MTHAKTSHMLLGALVSDAACLGLHWLYDVDRIAQIAARQGGHSAFTPVDAANFEGVAGYFAHGGRVNGMLTQYGEVLLGAIRSMNANAGKFDVAAYAEAFAAQFGAGGTYQGYIDRPTEATLANIADEKVPTGVDDDQNPALARLPAILAAYHDQSVLPDLIDAAVQITNVNPVATAYAHAFTDVGVRVLAGEAITDALAAAAQAADATIQPDLLAALSAPTDNSTDYAGDVGRACHLPTAGPVAFHILKHSAGFQDAVERNILAGGDSAGRSIMLGAILGAAHGVATQKGIPLAWILQLEEGADIWTECSKLGAV